MMYSNVIVGITIFRGSFMFSQSRVKVPASLTNRDLKQTLEAARWTSTGSKISRSLANYYNHVVFCPRPPSVAAARKATTLVSDLELVKYAETPLYSQRNVCLPSYLFFYLQIFDISFALQRKSRFTLKR